MTIKSIELVFASSNTNKVLEVSRKLKSGIKIIGLHDTGCTNEIPETADSLEGNAQLKAEYISKNYNRDCFADDTGLEVESLNGRPGVYSARYAGEPSDSAKNIELLLDEMDSHVNRKARFRTVICLISNREIYFFEGICTGHITREKCGKSGFGYDPVFVPTGNSRTFAEMSTDEKNLLSHRGIAIRKLDEFLIGK
jgi:XTP/dITP diphosphohydrolase